MNRLQIALVSILLGINTKITYNITNYNNVLIIAYNIVFSLLLKNLNKQKEDYSFIGLLEKVINILDRFLVQTASVL